MAWQLEFDKAFRTTISVLILPLVLGFYSSWAIILALVGARQSRINAVYTGFARAACWVAGTRVQVHGLENIRPGKAYVVVPNHESNFDPVVVTHALNMLPIRFVAKKQIIRIPIFGHALLATGNVRVERTNTQGDVERIRARMAERPVEVSILFYAEGTRSRDGAFHAFKKGAFATAIAYGLDILPVGTSGTRRIWQPLRFGVRSGPAIVLVGRPIPIEGLTHDDRDKLRDTTFDAVRELRTQARRRLRAIGFEAGGID
jgi:1-acyl-sn-glycerol-3-phosphate acyltransferase